ncbi:MAG TPA: DNA translocase FtsK 4TM domain-containing protein [Candidatus Polarisedimenticolia bacterium]|nr:DNA translocase FtsK 4TM domain-containing protein [Candidatus Polarisedimenticolia bacterium]
MSRRRRKRTTPRPSAPAARGVLAEGGAIVLMACAVLLVLSLVSHHETDPVPWPLGQYHGEPVHNIAGIVGAFLSDALYQTLGWAAWSAPLLMLLLGWRVFFRVPSRPMVGVFGSGLLLFSLTASLELALGDQGSAHHAGGFVGCLGARALAGLFNRWGALVVALALSAMAIVILGRSSVVDALRAAARHLGAMVGGVWLAWVRRREARRRELQRQELAQRQRERLERGLLEEERRAAAAHVEPRAAASIPVLPEIAADTPHPPPPAPARAAPAKPAQEPQRTARRGARTSPGGGEAKPGKEAGQPEFDFVESLSNYTPPPLSLLDPPQHESQVDEKELVETARLITEKCREFDVNGQVIAIQPGPVVTVFEFKPDAGVKYSRIVSMTEDLCLAIKAESIRIDRLPGKSTVGIEVPNRKREVISLRELLSSERFQRAPASLTLALGKEINGEPYYSDLARMPHLLVAGSTGSGKSVCLNTVLTSILYKASPEEVKFIMIDPKRLELGLYENIPHLLTPLVTDTKKAGNALRWAVVEMERRYKQLAEAGVRSIDQYNVMMRKALGRAEAQADQETASALPLGTDGAGPAAGGAAAAAAAAGEAEPPLATRKTFLHGEKKALLPYVVILIDELADLMMTTGREVEEAITRLAQMARAVGIHLILSTQRPSVDIITGVIKANFPCRIAMRVSSKVDSRTILDANGAEHLLGHGDMLFIPPGSARLIRLHGPLVTEVEATRIVTFLKKQAKPVYDETVTKDEAEAQAGMPGGGPSEQDPAYNEAVRIAVQMGQISVSHIQRRLKLGYARAARLVDMMEQNGIVGPADGSKPREVLVEPDFLARLDQMREEQG